MTSFNKQTKMLIQKWVPYISIDNSYCFLNTLYSALCILITVSLDNYFGIFFFPLLKLSISNGFSHLLNYTSLVSLVVSLSNNFYQYWRNELIKEIYFTYHYKNNIQNLRGKVDWAGWGVNEDGMKALCFNGPAA